MSSKPSLRTTEGEHAYRQHRAGLSPDEPCPLCYNAPATTMFTYWKIAENLFPYGRVAQKHDMLLPLRHVTEVELTKEELQELLEIKNNSIADYSAIFESTHDNKSIPNHFHLHLVIWNPSIV